MPIFCFKAVVVQKAEILISFVSFASIGLRHGDAT